MMMTSDKLNQLSEFYSQRELLNLKKQELIDQVLTPELKKQIGDIEAEFQLKTIAVEENITYLEADIKKEVLATGATAKGLNIMAVWNKGRTSWDSDKLKGMAILIPQLKEAMKVGEPTVSFRKI